MDADIVERLAELAREVGDVEVSAGRDYARSGRVFAAAADHGVELLLGPDIAEAARRTPDTLASARGDGWVRFVPKMWDDHAADRLEAWFRVAWRAAGHR